MPDRLFSDPRLADIYDEVDDDRRDLHAYLALAEELGARSVLDIGCGTGSLACLLAARGIEVTGLDPAAASLDVARRKPAAELVSWIAGDVGALPPLQVDLVTMTGNVAQVFLDDGEWAAVLRAAHASSRPHGHLVFETRVPARRAWLDWTRERSRRRVETAGAGAVETWHDVTEVAPPLVTFRTTYRFERDGAVLTSDSTLRFREREEVEESLAAAGYAIESVREAPDRPGLEMVFVARAGG